MENNQPSKLKSALNFGALLGLVLLIISLIIFIFEMYDSGLNWLSTIVLIAGIVYGIKNYRDRENGGFISYGSALGYGTLIALFAGIISAFGTYIYLGYVDDGFIEFQQIEAEERLYEMGMDDDMIEQQLEMQSYMMKPAALSIIGVFGTTILGFIVSLIAAAILKKEPDYFEDTE